VRMSVRGVSPVLRLFARRSPCRSPGHISGETEAVTRRAKPRSPSCDIGVACKAYVCIPCVQSFMRNTRREGVGRLLLCYAPIRLQRSGAIGDSRHAFTLKRPFQVGDEKC